MNAILYLELFVGICIVTFVMLVSYVGLKNTAVQEVFKSYSFLHPNSICRWRIVASIPLVVGVVVLWEETIFVSILTLIYIFLFATDALDGQVARHCNLVTEEGKRLDPYADKVLDLPILGALCIISGEIAFVALFAIIFVCDIIGQMVRGKNGSSAATWVGKSKTVYKIMAIYSLSIMRFPEIWHLLYMRDLSFALLVLSTIFAFMSMVSKMRKWKVLKSLALLRGFYFIFKKS